MMKFKLIYLFCAIMALAGCSEDPNSNVDDGSNRALEVNVGTSSLLTKAIIDNYFNDGDKIGVFVCDSSEQTYDDQNYFNKYYTVQDGGASQYWSGDEISLSYTDASINAYYPYDQTVTDFSQIEVKSGDVDYMYSDQLQGVNRLSNKVQLTMNHALACIRMNISKDTFFSGEGIVEELFVSGGNIGEKAVLNAYTGSVSSVENLGYTLTKTTINDDITNGTISYDFIVVHDNSSAELTLGLKIDGKEYRVTKEAYSIEQNTLYEYKVTVKDTFITVDLEAVAEWGFDKSNEGVDELNYDITFTGDIDQLTVYKSVEGEVATINVVPNDDYKIVSVVDTTGTAIIDQTPSSSGSVSIVISELQSDIEIDFAVTDMKMVEYKISGDSYSAFVVTSNNNSWQVDFGDGTSSQAGLTISEIAKLTHTYTDGLDVHTVRLFNSSDDVKIREINPYANPELVAFSRCDYDCSYITSLAWVFSGCTGLVDVSALANMTSVTNLYYAFKGCTSLLDISPLAGMVNVENVASAFNGCSSLEVAVEWWDNTTYPNITSMYLNCYNGCTKISSPFLYSEIPSSWK